MNTKPTTQCIHCLKSFKQIIRHKCKHIPVTSPIAAPVAAPVATSVTTPVVQSIAAPVVQSVTTPVVQSVTQKVKEVPLIDESDCYSDVNSQVSEFQSDDLQDAIFNQ